MSGQRGMTLVELLVSVAIVVLVIAFATTAYIKLLRTYKTQGRLAEGYMANLTGLELLRYDIETAGFGLPANLGGVAGLQEAKNGVVGSSNYNPSSLNDLPNNPPRAIAHLNNIGPTNPNQSDVLVIKSSPANLNTASKKWSMINWAGGANPSVKQWGVGALDPIMDFVLNDVFIIVDFNGALQSSAGAWWFTFNTSASGQGYYSTTTGANPLPSPGNGQVLYYIYGLDTNSGGAHNMPFNRVDYYLDLPAAGQYPSTCAATTFSLYRSTVNQDGSLNTSVLLDCVRDFQVAFGFDSSGTGTAPIQWQTNLAGLTALQIQQQLREVRVFILYQDGPGSVSTSPSPMFSGFWNLGDQDIANSLDPTHYPTNTFSQWSNAALPGNPSLSSFNPAGADLNYRWKIVEIAVKTMNLMNLGAR